MHGGDVLNAEGRVEGAVGCVDGGVDGLTARAYVGGVDVGLLVPVGDDGWVVGGSGGGG